MAELFNEFTNRRGLLVYGGEASSNYGMVIAEAPSFDKPTRKNTVYNVPGRNGAIIFQEDAFEDITRSYRVGSRTMRRRISARRSTPSRLGYIQIKVISV